MMGKPIPENRTMSITITDPALLAQLTQAGSLVDIRDPSGNIIGRFIQENGRPLPPGVKSPITDEEFEEARKQTGGRPLADIIRDLERKYGK
jgi:hypothetical protein